MEINILTIFPDMFASPLSYSIIKRAQEGGIIKINLHDLRDFTTDRHRTTDDYPYGGGAGMVMKVEPIGRALEALKEAGKRGRAILMSPQGKRLDQAAVKGLASEVCITIICGRYEGVDERVRLYLVDEEISIGDYVTTGGELPAMVLIDAVCRLLPGAVGKESSVKQDSFYSELLDHPHYTRPFEYQGLKVPGVLLSGDHKKIERWRRKEALRRTLIERAELLLIAPLSELDRQLLDEIRKEQMINFAA